MLQRILRATARCALLVAIPSLAVAQAHPEFKVGRNAAGKLGVQYEAEKPYPLPASRLDGIPGYADAMPGLFSMFVAKPGDELLPMEPESDIEFVLIGADEGFTVLNDTGTATMRAGETFHIGHPPFDTHPVWCIAADAAKKSYQLKIQVRDRAGRYQPSEVLTASFAPDDSTQIYVCPMRCELGKQYAVPGNCPVCLMRLKLFSGRNYRVNVTPDAKLAPEGKLQAGVATPLTFDILAPDGKRADDLDVVHEKLVHLLMVSDDLSWFAHEHPELQADGRYTLTFAFPRGGKYVLYHDFTPKRAGMQVVPVELDVAGDAAASVPLKPGTDHRVDVDGYTVKLTTPMPLTSLRSQNLKVSVSRAGQPVTDLEPFLGALGHIIVISGDKKQFVHSHPLETASALANPNRRGGPDVVFSAQFPANGVYKAWAQFQHKGQVITAPFVFEVVSMMGRAPAPAGTGGSGGQR